MELLFGDGASSQGVLHESMNLASIWKLPVIFACENNQYAEATPSWYAVSVEDIADRAASYNIPGVIVDGMDVFQVYEAAEEAVARARKGLGPTLLELKTYRYHGHFHADQTEKYRTQDEENEWKNRDCIKTFEKKVTEQKLMTKAELNKLKKNIEKEIEDAVEFGLSSPLPPQEVLYEDVYVNYSNDLRGLKVNREEKMTINNQSYLGPGYDVKGNEMRYRDAFNNTLRAELEYDKNVLIIGEDISGGFDKKTKEPLDAWGGPFAATKGLVQDFGTERIMDAPISEAGFVGAAIGAALTGLRPVVDLCILILQQ